MKPPTRTGQTVDFSDKTRYDVYSDGSYRRTPPKVKGKANVKRKKRGKSYIVRMAEFQEKP